MHTKRMTKRELREDPVLESITRTTLWIQANTRYLLIGAGAVVVVGLLAFLLVTQHRQHEEDASVALLKAEYQFTSGDLTAATAAFQDIQNRFGGTSSALRALRDQGDAMFLMGRSKEAETLYQKYLSKVKPNTVDERAGLFGLAGSLEQTHDFAKGAEVYGKLADKSPNTEFGSIALWGQGRCWNMAGQYAKAAQSYQRLLTEHPRSRYTNIAKQELAEAQAKAGQL